MGTLIGDKDADFFDARVREINRLAGTCAITYYALNFEATPKDPLYGEPIEEIHVRDPLRDTLGIAFSGLLEYPEQSVRTGEEGQHADYDASLWLARKDFEEKFPIPNAPKGTPCARQPKVGDVIQVQDRYYDVMAIDAQGQFNDTIARHANWLLKLKHRTEFDARRRLEGK
jgi:hypothetical protein